MKSSKVKHIIKEEINSYINEQTYKVYHGTNSKFDKFDMDRATQGVIWFTDSVESIKNQSHGGLGNKYIMTRYITINNPAGWDEYEKYSLGEIYNMGYDGIILDNADGPNQNNYIMFSQENISETPPPNFK